MKNKIMLIALLIGSIGFAQNNSIEWPRAIKAGDNYIITLYQPQLETLKGNKLNGRLALSIKDKSDKIIFGALWFEARLSTDLETRLAVLEALDIPKIKFPDIENEDNIALLKSVIIKDLSAAEIEMSIDDIITNIESIEANNVVDETLSNQAPSLFFRQKPTVLVSIDGEPILKKEENESIEYVVNTPFFIVKKKNKFYLKGEKTWYTSDVLVANDWKVTTSIPKDVIKLADKSFDNQEKPKTEDEDDSIPDIIVVTTPAELIVTEGDLEYKPIGTTSLLYVDNTESDIILEIETQTHFVLLNGRWYASKTLNDNDWQFVEPEKLPRSFNSIPADGESISSVRSSIPGTEEAKEAMYEQYIPQTAVVDKKTASTKVEYDGNPKFQEIEGTTMQYALNTQSTVLKIDNIFYAIDNGVWFESNAAIGPWKVSDKRPDSVDDIPPSSPVYNVKYVYIYDSTPNVVYVGYTPGYYHSYVYGGVVVYGTGYYYNPWYGSYYYPRPVTYGFGVHYNPYTGWGFSVGVSYGWMTVSIHSHGYWGPAGYRHGYRHGYHHGYHHGYNNGYAAGYARGRYDSNNIYRNNNGNTRRGVSTRKNSVTSRNNLTTRPNNTNRTRNDIYADKAGNIHQRDANGKWREKRNKAGTSRNNSQKTKVSRETKPSVNRSQQRSQLENQYKNRTRSNTNKRSYNNNRSSQVSRRSVPRRRG
ncbi:MAG: hypothetical protein V7719_14375 [Psychroserpens sp.]|uniref:hypothetical protein n=1 Tax=Psychroserpens sp. TaxID=2020870 RepID=UPI003002421D